MEDAANAQAHRVIIHCHKHDHYHGSLCACLCCISEALHARDQRICELENANAALAKAASEKQHPIGTLLGKVLGGS